MRGTGVGALLSCAALVGVAGCRNSRLPQQDPWVSAGAGTQAPSGPRMPYDDPGDLVGKLPAGAERLLDRNGFVVLGDVENSSLASAYLTCVGTNFITSDAVLYVFHCLFRGGLSAYEEERMLPLAEQLARRGLAAARGEADANRDDPALREPARRNVVLFAVAKALLDGQPPTDEVDEVSEIVRKITEAKEAGFYPNEDYTVYAPRGVYADDPDLARYFRAMKWMSRVMLPIIPGALDKEPEASIKLRQAYLLGSILTRKPVGLAWQELYDEVSFFVARPDSFTPTEFRETARGLPGFPSDEWVAAVRREYAQPKYPESKIEPVPQGNPGDAPRKYVQLMGERFIPDGQIHQEACFPHVSERTLPKGLDIGYALFGSLQARTHLEPDFARCPGLEAALDGLHGQFVAYASEENPTSIYSGWIGAVREALHPPDSPDELRFLGTEAWRDKSLTTALASWTYMRHDFVLYAKEPMIPGCGGMELLVEPVPEAYRRLALLAERLDKRNFVGMGDFAELCSVLEKVSRCELEGKRWQEAADIPEKGQWDFLLGAFVQWLLHHFTPIVSDERPAVVVDVATDSNPPNRVLHEATGPFHPVIVPGEYQRLTGWVLSYYEFAEPNFIRLTDRQWQERVVEGKHRAARPEWVRSYMYQR